MALTLVNSGTLAPDPGENEFQSVTEPGVYVVVLNLLGVATCTVRVSWELEMDDATMVNIWHTAETDLAATPPDYEWHDGVVLPPMPVARTGAVIFDLVSGTPTGLVAWDLFSL